VTGRPCPGRSSIGDDARRLARAYTLVRRLTPP
jgi:hypothetical protein